MIVKGGKKTKKGPSANATFQSTLNSQIFGTLPTPLPSERHPRRTRVLKGGRKSNKQREESSRYSRNRETPSISERDNNKNEVISDNNQRTPKGRVKSPTCVPECQDGCHHGECIEPNVCQCNEGYKGSDCNISECLLFVCFDI